MGYEITLKQKLFEQKTETVRTSLVPCGSAASFSDQLGSFNAQPKAPALSKMPVLRDCRRLRLGVKRLNRQAPLPRAESLTA
jgi:hypothetical protein